MAADTQSGSMRKAAGGLLALLVLVSAVAVARAGGEPRRIVSLVPSVTETLFAVGAGKQVVAVSSYDREPPEVERLPRVGALIDPNVERILSLRPDLVVVYASQADLREQMRRAGISTWPFAHAGLSDVARITEEIGALTGHVHEGNTLAASIMKQIEPVRAASRGVPGRRCCSFRSRAAGAAEHLRERRGRLPPRPLWRWAAAPTCSRMCVVSRSRRRRS